MKIAIILRQATISGGGERQAIMLARELSLLGHEITIYAVIFDRVKCFPDDIIGLEVVTLSEEAAKRLESEANSARGLARLFRENKLAKVVAELIKPGTSVLNPNDNWGAHVAYFFQKKYPRSSSVLMLNDLDTARWSLFSDPIFGRRRNLLKWPIHYFKDVYERFYLKSQKTIVVLNNRSVGLVKKYLNREAVVVRTGIDLEGFKFVEHLPPKRTGKVLLLSHGIFYVHRRYEDTIKAVAILRYKGFDVELDIIGDYNHKSSAKDYHLSLLKLVESLGLNGHVDFRGRVSDEELRSYYYKANIFVSAAHMQTWGLAVFEAIGSGLPVAISETIGAAEVLKDRETGMIFKALNPDSQAAAIEELITDEVLYQKLSLLGRDFVNKNLSWRRYAEDMLGYFKIPAK